jgi:hypothetical protein
MACLDRWPWSYVIFGGTVLVQVVLLVAGSYLMMADPTARYSFLLSASLLPGHFGFIVTGLLIIQARLRIRGTGYGVWCVYGLTARALLSSFATLVFLVAGPAVPNPLVGFDLACHASGCCGWMIIVTTPWSKLWAFLLNRLDQSTSATPSTVELLDFASIPTLSFR